MTDVRNSFEELLARTRRGDEEALAELVQSYEREVRIVARARISAALQPYVDSVDLVQSVHRSLLIGLRNERYDISTPDRLLALALTIVRRKVARHWRRTQRQKRVSGPVDQSQFLADLILSAGSAEIDPADEAALRDGLNWVLEKMKPNERQLILLRLQGYSTVDAARQLNLDPDVTRVQLSRLRRRLEDLGIAGEIV